MINFKSYRPKTFPRRSYFSPSYMHNVQVDLLDFNKQGGTYVMNMIDVFSRRAESVRISGKSSNDIRKGLNELFTKFGQKPKLIQSDKEKGLYGLQKELNEQGIKIYSVDNAYDYKNSAPIIERFNRTMRDYFNYIDSTHPKFNMRTLVKYVVDNFPKKYNNTIHHTLKAKPIDISTGKIPAEDVMQQQLNRTTKIKHEVKGIENKFKIGDMVFVPSVPPVGIETKMNDRWLRTPFKIEKIIMTNPRQYQLEGRHQKYYYKQLRKASLI